MHATFDEHLTSLSPDHVWSLRGVTRADGSTAIQMRCRHRVSGAVRVAVCDLGRRDPITVSERITDWDLTLLEAPAFLNTGWDRSVAEAEDAVLGTAFYLDGAVRCIPV